MLLYYRSCITKAVASMRGGTRSALQASRRGSASLATRRGTQGRTARAVEQARFKTSNTTSQGSKLACYLHHLIYNTVMHVQAKNNDRLTAARGSRDAAPAAARPPRRRSSGRAGSSRQGAARAPGQPRRTGG